MARLRWPVGRARWVVPPVAWHRELLEPRLVLHLHLLLLVGVLLVFRPYFVRVAPLRLGDAPVPLATGLGQ